VKNYITHDAVQKITPIREPKQAKHAKSYLAPPTPIKKWNQVDMPSLSNYISIDMHILQYIYVYLFMYQHFFNA